MDYVTLLGIVFAGGAAWGGATMALNGTRKRVAEVHTELTSHVQSYTADRLQMVDRLARIETKLDSKD